jgi:hypothetical protein
MWSLVATVLSGSFILATLVIPQIGAIAHLSNSLMIIAAAVLGMIVAIPVAVLVTKSMLGPLKAS